MRQRALAKEAFENYRRPTRREQFLAGTDRVVSWRDLAGVIAPH